MNVCFPKYVPVFLVSALTVAGGCTSSNDLSPTTPTAVESAGVTAEPLTVAPELRPDSRCFHGSPFGLRFVIVLRSGGFLTLRRLRFVLNDRVGRSELPLTIQPLISMSGPVTIPSSMPVPIPRPTDFPSSPPIPIPGTSLFDDDRISPGALRRLPFLLGFGCGVPSTGILVVSVDTVDQHGRPGTSHVSIRVGH